MATDRKKPGVAFWATVVVVGVLMAYPLSFGPACWWFSKCKVPQAHLDYNETFDIPRDLAPHAPQAYWPMGWLAAHGPVPISRLLFWYATAGGQQLVALPCDRDGNLSVSSP
jgi:hypothetical protein